MYTFKQNMSKEVCVAWWPEAIIQRCKLRAAQNALRCLAVCSDLLRRATATPSLHGPGEASNHLFPLSRTPSHLLIIISTLLPQCCF